MKLKYLFILLFATLLLGCDRQGDSTQHYIYSNVTSRTVSVQAFVHYPDDGYKETKAKFALQPGEKFTLSYFPVGGFDAGRGDPFEYANEVVISNGDTTIVHTRDNIWTVYRSLLRKNTYEQYKSKNGKNLYAEFVFTDKDFENAEPVE